MRSEDISPDGNKLACVVSSTAKPLEQWEKERNKRQKRKRQSRTTRERLAEARKYTPLADCKDGL